MVPHVIFQLCGLQQLGNVLAFFVVDGIDVAHSRLHRAVLELIHNDLERSTAHQ
mgnify:CR=1 FL=1